MDRRGKVVARYGAGTEPDAPELTQRVGELLARPDCRFRPVTNVCSCHGRTHPTARSRATCGECSAIGWLSDAGRKVFLPFGHSPDVDLVADLDGRLIRVQVKTSTVDRNGRYEVTLATRGGNQSWSGVVKRFSPTQCDYLFVHVGDGRRWFIPSEAVEGGTGIVARRPEVRGLRGRAGRSARRHGGAPDR